MATPVYAGLNGCSFFEKVRKGNLSAGFHHYGIPKTNSLVWPERDNAALASYFAK